MVSENQEQSIAIIMQAAWPMWVARWCAWCGGWVGGCGRGCVGRDGRQRCGATDQRSCSLRHCSRCPVADPAR